MHHIKKKKKTEIEKPLASNAHCFCKENNDTNSLAALMAPKEPGSTFDRIPKSYNQTWDPITFGGVVYPKYPYSKSWNGLVMQA